MLVLTRKQNQDIIIQLGHRVVRVRVLDAGIGRVRLGVDAPPDVTVHRQEVWQRLREWNEPDSSIHCSTG